MREAQAFALLGIVTAVTATHRAQGQPEMSRGIDDFSVGERVLFVKQQFVDEDGNLNPAWGDGVVASINRDTATIELNVRTPRTSYDAPVRIDQSFQHGRQATGAMDLRAASAAAEMNRPATADCCGVDALK